MPPRNLAASWIQRPRFALSVAETDIIAENCAHTSGDAVFRDNTRSPGRLDRNALAYKRMWAVSQKWTSMSIRRYGFTTQMVLMWTPNCSQHGHTVELGSNSFIETCGGAAGTKARCGIRKLLRGMRRSDAPAVAARPTRLQLGQHVARKL